MRAEAEEIGAGVAGPQVPAAPVFDLRDLSIAYDGVAALRRIRLHVMPGEKLVLIGPSGAGKTTLLRHLYQLAGPGSAFIHQDYALVPQLTVFHNVYAGRLDAHSACHNLRTLLWPAAAEVEAVGDVLQLLGMGDRIHDRVQSLSGGQQQRVAVARAIFRGSPLILGDEPVSAIDPHQSGRVLELLKDSAATVILAMHDVQLALEHFARIVAIRDGQVVFDLSADLVDDERLGDLFRAEQTG